MASDDSNPPLAQAYSKIHSRQTTCEHADMQSEDESEIELPLIDVKSLTSEDNEERAKCAIEIARASSEWGFFQVVNHGVSPELLTQIRREQVQLFNTSFSRKSTSGLLDNSYRWGTPTATSPEDFSWSEAFHIPITKISDQSCYGEEFLSLREVMVEYAAEMQKLAKLLAGALVANLGEEWEDFDKMLSSCDDDDDDKSTCFFRLNRYPTCTVLSTQEEEVYGLVPHTDTDLLTILEQDQVGGLKLMKDSKWVTIKPRKDALIVNIGDLFKAWSNNLYNSVEHKVMANPSMERYSVAYFLCPSYDALIKSSQQPSIYRDFTFEEYRNKVQEDTKLIGRKIGLSRFLR